MKSASKECKVLCQSESSNIACQEKDFVLTSAESAALEKLFDKLIDNEDVLKKSNTETSLASFVSNNENDDGTQVKIRTYQNFINVK